MDNPQIGVTLKLGFSSVPYQDHYFFKYILMVPEGLRSVAKLFADDTSLFSVVLDPKIISLSLNEDLLKINQWAYRWKMLFNPDT